MYTSLLSGLTRLSLWWRSLAAMTLVAAVVACGGGGGDGPLANVTGGGTGSFASGPITGFGSIIVNGVRFDDSKASVKAEDDDDNHSSNELKLGMMVTVNGSAVSPGSTATASSITFSSELKGSITSKIGTDTLVVHGVNVLITATTVCEVGSTTGCASLKTGDFIEVHGFFAPATASATAKLTATRIELEAVPKFLKLRGAISNLNTASKTFNIGTQTATVTYADIKASSVPASLTNGLVVRVKVDVTPTVAGLWNAVRIKVPNERKVEDRDEAKIEGVITTAIDASKTFSVNGLKVDASNASLPAGGTAALVVGARVEVEGKIVNGVLVATKVQLDDERGNGEGNNELHGTISKLDTTAKTFEVRGVTVDYSAATFSRGNAGNLVDNVSMVEVKGDLSADGTKVKAKTVKFEN